MKKTENLFNLLRKQKLVALLSPKGLEDCITAYETLHPLGVTLEIAFRTQTALQGIQKVLEKYPEALILAGTVMTAKQAEAAIHAGAAGIVSADYIEDVVRVCVEHDIMCFPGGIADVGKQLALKAKYYGCDFQELAQRYPYQWVHKLFPAMTATVSFLGLGSAWKGPFKNLQVMYTGGINLQNLPQVVAHDPDGIICGSALTKDIDDPIKMRQQAEQWLEIIRKREGGG